MNIEDTKKAIEVMQAYVDGKEVVITRVDTDQALGYEPPFWDFTENIYSIKPEPIVRWMCPDHSMCVERFFTDEELNSTTDYWKSRAIKLVEEI